MKISLRWADTLECPEQPPHGLFKGGKAHREGKPTYRSGSEFSTLKSVLGLFCYSLLITK